MPQDHSSKKPPEIVYAAIHKTDPDAHSCIADSAYAIAIFMWGRGLSEYQLYVNNREYDWAKSHDIHSQEEHLKHCLDFDRAFYFPDEILLDTTRIV